MKEQVFSKKRYISPPPIISENIITMFWLRKAI